MGFIRNLIDTVRSEGCGTNHAERSTRRKTGAIANPMLFDARPVGCMNVNYLARAVTPAQAVGKYADPLRSVVTQISELKQAKAPPAPELEGPETAARHWPTRLRLRQC
jgi:IclR family mhp operon transcriptional activator